MTRPKGSVFVSIFCSGKENDFHWFNIYFFLAVVYAMLVAFRPTYRWFRWMFRYLKESRIDTIAHAISTSSKIIQNRMESYYESNGLSLDYLLFYVFVCFFGLTMLKFCFWRFSFLFYWFAFFVYELVIIWTWLSSWNIRCAHQTVLNNEHTNMDIKTSDSLSSIFFLLGLNDSKFNSFTDTIN